MQLKRKRSESELSFSSSSTGSTFNSPLQLGASPFAFSHVDAHNESPTRRIMSAPSHLPSRTMKRFRDNRPSEEEVHQRTIDMLFSAAQKPQAQHHEAHLQPQLHAVSAQPSAPAQQQTSLHSFWKLPNSHSLMAASASMASPRVDTSIYAPSDCEDCGQSLRGGNDDMDVDMDIDGFGADQAEATGCAGCGKHVCSHCSITNMGERRRCLGCADTARKVWVGGLGWTSKPGGLGVC